MNKKALFLILSGLSFVTGASVYADMITCTASGNTFGVVRISAHTDVLADEVGDIYSSVTVKNADGRQETLPMFITKGSLSSGFKIAPDFYTGPFGKSGAYLAKSKEGYELQTKTFCNFYYQEETCQDGELIDQKSDAALHCSLDN